MALEKYVDVSGRVRVDDLDWEACRAAGLTERERFVLEFFADIESQTVIYMRDLLLTRTAMEPEVGGFLSMWNYEEFFHGRSLTSVLEACGYPQEEGRAGRVRAGASFKETFDLIGSGLVSRTFDSTFPPLMFAWGAMNENLTTQGYDAIVASTTNPVLRTLASRIAKQERRHFAFYQNLAKERMVGNPAAQRLARVVLTAIWQPVGAGVKTDAELRQLMSYLFVGREAQAAAEVDRRLQQLPGLQGVTPMTHWYLKTPAWKRVWSLRGGRQDAPAETAAEASTIREVPIAPLASAAGADYVCAEA
jgi:rubrerythrin